MMHYKFISAAHLALAAFLHAHASALQNASWILGGENASKRVTALLGDLSEPVSLTRRLARELEWLEQLLTLELTTEIDSVEAASFAAIDPMDPVVSEICLLTDGYINHIEALKAETPQVFASLHAAA